jgi:toxin ParE1/3/4
MMKKTLVPLKIHLSEPARIDLAGIWDYLFEESSELTATQFLERIEARIGQAARFPFSGAPRPHLSKGLRVLFHERYAIYYLPGEEEIVIVRVLHGARDIAAIAEEGGFSR